MLFAYLGVTHHLSNSTLLPISEFVLGEKFQQNASKFAIFDIYENPTPLAEMVLTAKVELQNNDNAQELYWAYRILGSLWRCCSQIMHHT